MVEQLAALLAERGLLLASDPRLPSVATVVAGGPVAGSWWGHPAGHAIYHALNALEDRPELRSFKLVKGKLTFVHRALWPALAAVALGNEAWQTAGLPDGCEDLLARLRRAGRLRLDELARLEQRDYQALAKLASALEARLLVVGGQLHTDNGKHVRLLTSWEAWCGEQGLSRLPTAAAGRAELERRAAWLLSAKRPKGFLPWG